MAIIDLTSRLKDGYKNDDSQPYVKSKEGNSYVGVVGKLNAKKDDVVRISKFLADPLYSPQFIANQVGLSQMSPLTENGEQDRMFLPTNILAQVGANITGGSVFAKGLNPLDKTIGYSKIKQEEIRDEDILSGKLIKMSKNIFYDGDTEIMSYRGGADSIFGVGRTTIKRVVDTNSNEEMVNILTNESNSLNYENDRMEVDPMLTIFNDIIVNGGDESITSFGNDFIRHEPNKLNTVERNNSDYSLSLNERLDMERSAVPKDFRAKLSNLINPVTGRPFEEAFEKFNLERRIGLSGGADTTIGQLPVYYSNSPTGASPKSKIYDTRINKDDVIKPSSDYLSDQIRDLVRFRIELIDSDNPNFGEYITLRSTITGFNKSYSSTWNPVNYSGRGETFNKYSSTNESISFNFTIYAKSKPEMRIMYQKLNTLISGAMYPSYSKKFNMRGSMIRLTVGDLMENQPCIVTSLNLTIPDDNSWEIALDTQSGISDGIAKDAYVLPMIIQGSMSITPIYNFLPQKSLSKSFFILPNEDVKGFRNLKWISGDMRKLEESIKSNKNAKGQTYISKFNDGREKRSEMATNVNAQSLNNANQYREFNA